MRIGAFMDFPQKIYSSKVKNLVLLLVCAVFVIGGIWIGGFWGWFNVVFFGLVVIVFGLQLLPNITFLLLTDHGFTVRSMFREHTCGWTDVGPFSIQAISRSRFVVFKFSPADKQHPLLKKFSLDNGMLPGSYALSLEELASKMNEARSAALKLERSTAKNEKAY